MSTKKLQLVENIFPSDPQAGQVLKVDADGNKTWADMPQVSFCVNFTGDAESGSFSADKTYDEILEAYNSGIYVYGICNGVSLSFKVLGNVMLFTCIMPEDRNINMANLIITADNSVILKRPIIITDSFIGSTSDEDGDIGYVPAPAAGDQDKYLKGDGTWANISTELQADWNQNDSTAADYIKNRPFYIGDEAYIGFLSFVATSTNTMDYTYTNANNNIFEYFRTLSGEVIKVSIDGESGLMSSSFDRGNFGFSGILSGSMNYNAGKVWSTDINSDNITLVEGNTYIVEFYDTTTPGPIPIDIKYLPYSVHTDDNSPVKRGSGENSTVQDNCTASGNHSHAEGSGTTASGSYSHAEGLSTTASGSYSHAEGSNTTANSEAQHVQGAYNILDTKGSISIRGQYAHIVGNGTSDTVRSNAYTLDWSGNAWFAGEVYTGSTSGTNKDDGSKKLATEEYVDDGLATKQDAGDYALKSEIPSVPVQSVNGQTGEITLAAADVGALPADTVIPSIDGLASETYVNNAVAGINAVPSATTDDNDKILMIVDGVPTWVAITNAEGVAY